MKRNKLTVVVIAKNEEDKIGECLQSAIWADEIVLIDNGSTDKTVAIAKQRKAKVFSKTTGSYKDLRNEGLKQAKNEWIFYLDADERVTPELRDEIILITSCHSRPDRESIQKNTGSRVEHGMTNGAYAIPRENIILRRRMRYGGWWPDYVKRLFLKEKLLGWQGDLHEEPKFVGKIGLLTNPMIHLKHDNLHDMAVKTNRWSNTEAKLLIDAKHPPMVAWRFFRIMFTELGARLLVKRGVLDGQEGVVYATYQSFSKFVTYAKLWEKQTLRKL